MLVPAMAADDQPRADAINRHEEFPTAQVIGSSWHQVAVSIRRLMGHEDVDAGGNRRVLSSIDRGSPTTMCYFAG
jgi:hypothetical protein